MNMPTLKPAMSVEEFLEWEAQQPEKYEFFKGEVYPHEVYAMVGARRVHVTIAGNIFSALKSHLRGGPCQTFISDMKVEAADNAFYPDILVTCHPEDLCADLVMRHPKVIIEVLSPSTADHEWGEKFHAYRTLSSLEEYALVAPETRQISVYRRMEQGDWLLVTRDSPKGLVLNSLAFQAPPEVVFEGV